MKSSDYWQMRAAQVEDAINQQSVQKYLEIEEQYRRTQRTIEGKINAWYGRFASNNDLSMLEAKKLLNSDELEEFKWDVEDYIRYGKENAINGQWMKQLENASARYHISRLESLKIQTQQEMEKLFGNVTDMIDMHIRDTFDYGYYHTAFEVQKGLGVGWDIASVNSSKLEKLINKPWAADGKNFSERIWGNKQQLINNVHTNLTQMCILGESPDKAINRLAKSMKTSKNQAGALIMTESAYFSSASQKEAFTELDVEEFEVVATLDSHTSKVCQEMDGQHFPMSEWVVGVTAPPFHVRCRSTTAPWFDDEFEVGERAARDVDGNTYYVPENMTYKEWKKQYVNSPVKVDQTQKITPKEGRNDYSVDRSLVNSKKYHDKFEGLTSHKAVNESIYQEAMKMLEHRDGTDYEDIVVLDARTGKVIIKNTLSVQKGKTGLTKEQYDKFLQHQGEVIILHNHPNSSRLSYTDISTLFNNPSIIGGVAVGHDGSVHSIMNLVKGVDIDKLWSIIYNKFENVTHNKVLAEHYALDAIYDNRLFDYERR